MKESVGLNGRKYEWTNGESLGCERRHGQWHKLDAESQ